MTDIPSTVLDHIDNIIVPGDVFKQPTNEYWALLCLRDGLELLYHQAARCDEMVKQQVNPQNKLKFMGFGNLSAFNQIPKTLLTCAFHLTLVRFIGMQSQRANMHGLLAQSHIAKTTPDQFRRNT